MRCAVNQGGLEINVTSAGERSRSRKLFGSRCSPLWIEHTPDKRTTLPDSNAGIFQPCPASSSRAVKTIAPSCKTSCGWRSGARFAATGFQRHQHAVVRAVQKNCLRRRFARHGVRRVTRPADTDFLQFGFKISHYWKPITSSTSPV